MRISRIEVLVVNVPFVAPIRWSGGRQCRLDPARHPDAYG